MSRLLHVQASPSGAASTSNGIAHAFLDAYRAANPRDEIDVVDVWQLELPPFDADMIAAKFAVLRKQDATPPQHALWRRAVAHAQRFDTADKVLISTPKRNFGVPYQLKHYIDVVTLPGQNWSWSRENGYVTLRLGRKAALALSSANDYAAVGAQDDSDHQAPYLRRWLRVLGIDDVQEMRAAPILTDTERVVAIKAAAHTQRGSRANVLSDRR